MKKTAQQKAIDNRANQLNPNNPAYYKSRMGNTPKKHNNNNHNHHNNQKTVVVHHHHNHYVQKPIGDQTRVCPICGAAGNVSFVKNSCKKYVHIIRTEFGKTTVLLCNSCGGTFKVKRQDY